MVVLGSMDLEAIKNGKKKNALRKNMSLRFLSD